VKLTNPQFRARQRPLEQRAPQWGIVRSVVDEGAKDWFESTAAAKEWLQEDTAKDAEARNEAQLVEELARAGLTKKW
jgi:DNA gyrase/topoisomerase IV subunit B